MTNARLVVMAQPSNDKEYRILPKYDWPMKIVHVTSGATHIFSYNLGNTEQKEQLKIKDDNAIGLKVVKQFGPLNLRKYDKLSHFMLLLNKLTI